MLVQERIALWEVACTTGVNIIIQRKKEEEKLQDGAVKSVWFFKAQI